MTLQLTSTKEQAVTHGVKMLVHGPAGAGKTRLCATTGNLDKTIILSAEAGLLSLRQHDIDVVLINGLEDMRNALIGLKDTDYEWVCIDSLSEVAERVLAEEMAASKDPRKAYGEMANIMGKLIRAFRDLKGRHVIMTCKTERIQHDGRLLWAPMLPGRQLGNSVSYWFDEVFALCSSPKDDGSGVVRYLQTVNDGYHEAKDRSGALAPNEPANLAHIVAKIQTMETDNG